MATDLAEILTDLTTQATASPRNDTSVAADARIALSRLRPALDRLQDDGLDTGASTTVDPDGFTRQAERVHWVRLLANTCARLGDATPQPATPGAMTRLADAAAVTAVLHADVLTSGQRWAIVAGLARTATHLVTTAGGGNHQSPDVDRALIIAEASSGVLFQFAALDPPRAVDYAALHRPVPDPAARPTSTEDAALEASAALVHATRPGTGPHSVADTLAVSTAASTACDFLERVAVSLADRDTAGAARDAGLSWRQVREGMTPFNDGSRRPQLQRPPAVESALALHRALQPTSSSTEAAPVRWTAPGLVTLADHLATVAGHLEVAVVDAAACGRLMAHAVDLPVRDDRVRPFLAGRRGDGLVTADGGDLASVRSALRRARADTATVTETVAQSAPRHRGDLTAAVSSATVHLGAGAGMHVPRR